jgi:hypothetical protein
MGRRGLELGGLPNVARRILESLRRYPTTSEAFEQLFATPFQIRLNSS